MSVAPRPLRAEEELGESFWKRRPSFAKERVAFRDGNCVVSLYDDGRNGKIGQFGLVT